MDRIIIMSIGLSDLLFPATAYCPIYGQLFPLHPELFPHTRVLSGDIIWGGGGGNMVDNFKDSKKGHNTPVGAFATIQL